MECKMKEGCGVIVECFVPHGGGKDGASHSPESLSCSGVYLGSGLVLTHGTVATDILQHPASQPVLQVLGSGGWVVNESCNAKGKNRVHHLSNENQPQVKAKINTHRHVSGESLLSMAISITQARLQAILPVSSDNEIAELTHTSTGQGQPGTKDFPHKNLTLKEWQNQDDGNMLEPLLNKEHILNNSWKQKSNDQLAEKLLKPEERQQEDEAEVNVRYPTNKHSVIPSTVRGTTHSLTSTQLTPSLSHSSVPAQIERLFSVPSLRQKIEGLMPASEGWKFTEGQKDGKESNSVIENIILSTFIVLRLVPNDVNLRDVGEMTGEAEVVHLVKRILARSSPVYKGATIYIESSPFGSLCPDVFLNSLSRGVISNAASPLLLTDARCILGSEGAPVLASLGHRLNLCAMVISPFCWCQGEWLGLTLLAAIQPILHTLLHSCGQSEDQLHSLPDHPFGTHMEERRKAPLVCVGWRDLESSEEMLIKAMESSVVGVWGGNKWGSGVVVSSHPPLILTCAHVTQPAQHRRVTVVLSDGQKLSGWVLHETQPTGPWTGKGGMNGGCLWDLAVVGVSQPLPPLALTLATHLPHTGSDVMVVGHGMFSPTSLPSPSISLGVMSKVITVPLTSLIWPSYPRVQSYQTSNHHQELGVGSVNTSYIHQQEDVHDRLDNFPKQGQSNDQTTTVKQHTPTKSLEHGQINHPPSIKSLEQGQINHYPSTKSLEHGKNNHSPTKAPSSTSHGYQDSNNTAAKQLKHQDTKDLTDKLKLNHYMDRDLSRESTRGQKHPKGNESVAVMMQTTCSVYAGSSGGPVIALHPTLGPLVVGIVTCNIRNTDKKSTFPNINMATPTPLIARIINTFIKTRDPRVLQLLDVACPKASHLWSLGSAAKAHL